MTTAQPETAQPETARPGTTVRPETAQPDRRERRKRETRDRILTAAIDLIVERGYEATTYDLIAERADLGRQTVFNHFPRKEDLVTAWVQARRDRLDALAADTAADPDRPPLLRLTELFESMADFDDRERAVARALYTAGVLVRGFLPGAPPPPALATLLTLARDAGRLAPDLDVAVAAEMLFDSYIGTLQRWLEGADDGFPLARMLRTKAELAVRGFAATP
ncbi:TetR/AcrR family transcriptional regulator [Kitasatospora sp. NPDC092948]|uniref:TetR/AcrR family transcriptional regulator n=1 Tax=Kitasatospora sp. NPDC092948 TaxID=3364088 RepID=UPI003805175B